MTARHLCIAACCIAACNGYSSPQPGPYDGGAPPYDGGKEQHGLAFYGNQAGLGVEVVDASWDEAGNVWAVSQDALFVKRPSDDFFRRYGTSDGLYVYKTITAVVGAGPNEAYVGLLGDDDGDPLNDPATLKQAGKLDHVHLLSDGSLLCTHLGDIHNYPYAQDYWETRSARRLLYVHDGKNAGHLFMGGNHGITDIVAADDSYGDHAHVEATWPDGSLVVGDWYGLAIDPATDGLWQCGAVACGLLEYHADTGAWVDGKFPYAFTVFLPSHDLAIPQGYREDHVAVAATPDDTVYFMSATQGVASWVPSTHNYMTIARRTVPGLGTPRDMVADTDGTLWLADAHQVLHWDPRAGTATKLALPTDDIRRLQLDARRRVLYVATGVGLAVYGM